jgi:hypothetical protein
MWNNDESFMNKAILAAAAVVVVGAGAGLYYYYKVRGAEPAQAAAKPAQVAPPKAADEPPAIANPVPEVPADAAKPLPALNESDPEAKEGFTTLFGPGADETFLTPENIVRRFVVTVDNLPRKKVATEMRALKPVTGTTAVTEQGDSLTLSNENFARYAPYIKLMEKADSKQLAAMYFRWYPLLQNAYEDLGYPGQYFNDRVVQVIDHLLETPNVRGPIALTQPKVFYEFADPTLEERSAGQKTLIRMGPENAAAVKQKLRELRTELTSGRDPPAKPVE